MPKRRADNQQVNELNFKIVRALIVFVGLALCAHNAAAQYVEPHGSNALRNYYSDLNQAVSSYELRDVPFQLTQVTVEPGDSLLKIARQHRFKELDFYHLAAALYDINFQAFNDGDASQLRVGATITMPTVGELFVAQERYEKLKVVGDDIDFTHSEDQMRAALRWPFGKLLVLRGPHAKDELPSNQEVTLTSYRPDALSIKGDSAPASFQARALEGTQADADIEFTEQKTLPEFNSKWLEQRDLLEDITTLAEIIPLQAAGGQLLTSIPPARMAANAEADRLMLADEVVSIVEQAPAPQAKVVGEEVTLHEVEIVSTTLAIQEAEAVVARIEKSDVEQIAVVQLESEPKFKSETMAALAPETALRKEQKPEGKAIKESAVKADELAELALFIANEKIATQGDKVAIVAVAAEPVVTKSTKLAAPDDDNGFYLGPPKISVASSPRELPSDPLSSIVEWNFDDTVSLGTALNRLADYVGYKLLSRDGTVLSTYQRRLPGMQLRVSGVTVEEGFTMLAGRGLETVFDHVSRSVKHVPMPSQNLKPKGNNTSVPQVHAKFLQQTGIVELLRQFPADIQNAAYRHAGRCESEASTQTPDARRLHNIVVNDIRKSTPAAVARNLVKWYDSPTGRKILELERGKIDELELQKFTVSDSRLDVIEQIYNDTVTGKGIASIAVELDYAGWTLSGCALAAEKSGDLLLMQTEMNYGQGIKKKFVRLESILRADMVRSMAFLFSPLSEAELAEYAEITQGHAGIYSGLQQSVINAITLETKEVAANIKK